MLICFYCFFLSSAAAVSVGLKQGKTVIVVKVIVDFVLTFLKTCYFVRIVRACSAVLTCLLDFTKGDSEFLCDSHV